MISTANVGIAVAFWKCNNNCKYMAYKHLVSFQNWRID